MKKPKPTPDRYHQIEVLFEDTGYESAFRHWFELQDIDPTKTTEAHLDNLRGQWLIDRKHHIAQLFRNTRFGNRFRSYFDVSGHDPRTTTRRELYQIWRDWNAIEQEVAIREERLRYEKRGPRPLTQKLVGNGLTDRDDLTHYHQLMKQGLHIVEEDLPGRAGKQSTTYAALMKAGLKRSD